MAPRSTSDRASGDRAVSRDYRMLLHLARFAMPYRWHIAGAIGALTSLDFLGLGVPPGTPSLGELLNQAKNNLDAWWIAVTTFGVLVVTLLLLVLVGDALRDALDPRKVLKGE